MLEKAEKPPLPCWFQKAPNPPHVKIFIANPQGHRMLKQNEENRILANMLPVVANSLREASVSAKPPLLKTKRSNFLHFFYVVIINLAFLTPSPLAVLTVDTCVLLILCIIYD